MSARLKIAILTLLLVLPTASRLRASDDPTTPTPPAQKKEMKEKKKHVVVQGPERIVVDDDGVFMEGDGDENAFIADLHGLEEEIPRTLRAYGFGGGYIGVQPIEMTEELREHFGAPKDAGILIGKVFTLPRLRGWGRITVGEIEHCQQFIRALEEVLAARRLAG